MNISFSYLIPYAILLLLLVAIFASSLIILVTRLIRRQPLRQKMVPVFWLIGSAVVTAVTLFLMQYFGLFSFGL